MRRAAAERRRLATECRATKTTARSAGSAMGPRRALLGRGFRPAQTAGAGRAASGKRFGRRSSSMSRRQSRSSARRAPQGARTALRVGEPRRPAIQERTALSRLSSSSSAAPSCMDDSVAGSPPATSALLSASRSSFAAARAAGRSAFTPVVPPRGRAAPSVLRLEATSDGSAVTRASCGAGLLRNGASCAPLPPAAGRPQPRWQETTVSRRRFERRLPGQRPTQGRSAGRPADSSGCVPASTFYGERGYKFCDSSTLLAMKLQSEPAVHGAREARPAVRARREPARKGAPPSCGRRGRDVWRKGRWVEWGESRVVVG